MPRSGIGLNDLLGRRCLAPCPTCRDPTPGRTVQQVWDDSLGWNLLRTKPERTTRAAENPHRQLTRGRFRTIVLALKLHLSEAELHHEWPPMPITRVRGANATDEQNAADRSEPRLQQCREPKA